MLDLILILVKALFRTSTSEYLMPTRKNKGLRSPLASAKLPDEHGKGIELSNYTLSDKGQYGKISAYFRDIEHHLVERIMEADCVLGCVAWLTNEAVLKALAKKPIAQIIIQKEDFLRPDRSSDLKKYKPTLRALYNNIPGIYRAHFGRDIAVSRTWTIVSESDRIDGVRCVGYRKRSHSKLIPIMHHKFLVFCNVGEAPHEDFPFGPIDPYAFWTGSFNFTRTATCSFENAVYVENPVIAEAFLREWSQLAALSEPLDWKHEYVTPQYWIGTGT